MQRAGPTVWSRLTWRARGVSGRVHYIASRASCTTVDHGRLFSGAQAVSLSSKEGDQPSKLGRSGDHSVVLTTSFHGLSSLVTKKQGKQRGRSPTTEQRIGPFSSTGQVTIHWLCSVATSWLGWGVLIYSAPHCRLTTRASLVDGRSVTTKCW
jgi:hypothetical protein